MKIEVVITKYRVSVKIVKSGKNWSTITIHPMCVIEEYARIFRVWDWFRPAHPPIKIERVPRVASKGVFTLCSWRMIENGASFCHVDISNAVLMSSPWSTSGNQV